MLLPSTEAVVEVSEEDSLLPVASAEVEEEDVLVDLEIEVSMVT